MRAQTGGGITPAQLVVATVFENRDPWLSETEVLFRTLRAFGGELRQARKVACALGEPGDVVRDTLAGYDVEVRVVDPLDARCPHASKLAMLDVVGGGDYLLMLDTDIAVAGDPVPWLSSGSISAKPVDNDPIGLAWWPALFEARGVALPTTRYLTDFGGDETIAYFNSGVVGVPGSFAQELKAAWLDCVSWVLDAYDVLPAIFGEQRFFTDQFAFALALAQLQLPVRALPLGLNFPTHFPVHSVAQQGTTDPVLLHYHHRRLPTGELDVPATPVAQQAIEMINIELTRKPDEAGPLPVLPGQEAFDNQWFWNNRYSTDLQLGSGVGSRGELASQKLSMLQSVIDEVDPESILDVGCGDIEIARQLRFRGSYAGVDISEVVLERNALLMPQWNWVHGDFVSLGAEVPDSFGGVADLVMCMDVLIHQHDADYYRAFVRELVRATRQVGIVAAYEDMPHAKFFGAITAYHGPITATLAEHGAQDIKIVDEYRGVTVVRFTGLWS